MNISEFRYVYALALLSILSTLMTKLSFYEVIISVYELKCIVTCTCKNSKL